MMTSDSSHWQSVPNLLSSLFISIQRKSLAFIMSEYFTVSMCPSICFSVTRESVMFEIRVFIFIASAWKTYLSKIEKSQRTRSLIRECMRSWWIDSWIFSIAIEVRLLCVFSFCTPEVTMFTILEASAVNLSNYFIFATLQKFIY